MDGQSSNYSPEPCQSTKANTAGKAWALWNCSAEIFFEAADMPADENKGIKKEEGQEFGCEGASLWVH